MINRSIESGRSAGPLTAFVTRTTGLVALTALAVLVAGCTGDDGITADPDRVQPAQQADGGDSGDAGSVTGDDRGSGIEIGEPDLIVLADEERSEDPALPPEFEDDERYLEPGDIGHVADPDEPALLDQGSALLCAAIEIGANAVAEGDTARVTAVSSALASERPSIGDDRLRIIADGLVADGLDPTVLGAGADRCEALGYESSI